MFGVRQWHFIWEKHVLDSHVFVKFANIRSHLDALN